MRRFFQACVSMRFCLFSTQQHWGGGETLIWTLAKSLELSGHQTCWVVRAGSEVADFIGRHDGHFVHQSISRSGGIRDWLQLSRALRRWKPDVLVLNDTHAVTLSAGVYVRKPKPIRLAYKHTVFPMRSPLKYRWLCDKLVCVSEASKRTVLDGGLVEKHCKVIYGGCPEPEVTPDARERIRNELKITGDDKLLVCVGNLLEIKGHEDLIRAIELVPSRNQLVVVIAGQGERKSYLSELISSLNLAGRIRLLGYRNDPCDLLAAADLVVHPSHAEGLSLVLIQARMLARPIVATPVGGAAEVLNSDTAMGLGTWLAEPANPRSLADMIQLALQALAENPDRIGSNLANAAETTRARFSVHESAQKLVDLSQQLIHQIR